MRDSREEIVILRLAMLSIACSFAYLSAFVMGLHGLTHMHRDFWIIVVSSGLATLLAVQSLRVGKKRDKN